MCVVSMVMDHYHDKWTNPPYQPWPPTSPISPAEVEEFRKLLERAREYDKRTGQPDCELEDKKRLLKELAEKLGVKIDFL